MSKVSVIVPVYNVEKYLKKCLDSLVNQTLQDIEIIVVNDSTPDNSQEIINEYVSTYPEKVKSYIKPNGGIADTRNFGLSKVNSEYFAFVDSDDFVVETMLEELYTKAKKDDLDIVTSDFYWYYSDDNKTLSSDGPYDSINEMLTKMFATLWNKLYKTDFVKRTGISFPVGYRYEDASFLYKLLTKTSISKVGYINKPFVYYVQREGSITHTHNDRVKDMIYVFEDLHSFYDENKNGYDAELEYLFIKFFLGNSFLRSVQIKDRKDRDYTVNLGFKVLNDNFPQWRKNIYLREYKNLKHLYFRSVNKVTFSIYKNLFVSLYKIKNGR
jgi:glycosyltransferase involved in cell wall biosynthesis